MAGTLYLGTSGFAYQEWKGPFYPERLRDAEMLPYYAGRFRSVEVNYTFRRSPSPSTLEAWRERTPDGFRFALKAHQRITHTLRLADTGEAVSSFLARARLLGERLGVVLFQCPPSLRFDRGLLEGFLAHVPDGVRSAMEFRHPSWEAARPLLADRGVAWCTAETDEAPAGEPSWEPFGYLRLRKESYTEDELGRWAERISGALADGRDVHCYFKHEEKATGPRFAEHLGELLG
ncbi:MAG TPA: DUF72 domain-containing protein [Actinomycetota bacterium]|nr:DUF72 domain-containing protein [Actinomycetota bacterium]